MIARISLWLYRVYRFHIFPSISQVRGAWRVRLLLKKWALSNLESVLAVEEDGYSYSYKGTEMKLQGREDFTELVLNRRDVIEGYTLKRHLEEEDTVVDAGAYPGEFTVYAAKKAKKVIALEPSAENAEVVRKNVELNDLNNVEVIEKGLWDSEEGIGFKGDGLAAGRDESSNTQISTTTLDELGEDNEIDFVKMDVEGAEIEAVKGAEKILKDQEPFFAIASYHEVEGEETWKFLEKYFRENGYHVETGFPDHKTTWASKQELS